MPSVSVNPPKSPVTKGSNGMATATIPNICKMPGPPAPFVPAPLPNIGKSGMSPKDYSQDVTIEGKAVAIKGSTFESMGDMASKGTGGGLISANTHGITKFVGPGSMDVKIEGKNVQLLSDPMLNNCGPSGSPPNAATLVGLVQPPGAIALLGDELCPLCGKTHAEEDTEDNNRTVVETGGTKGAAGELQAMAMGIVASGSNAAKSAMNMVAAVECVTGSIFVAVSGSQHQSLLDKITKESKPWHRYKAAGATSPDPKERFANKVNDADRGKFRDAWDRVKGIADEQWETRKRHEEVTEELFNQPGSCAAQQALVLALDHGNRPKGITERWPKGGPGVQLHYRTSPGGAVKKGRFGGDLSAAHVAAMDSAGVPEGDRQFMGPDKSCPPCGTCQVLLTALMCNQKDKTCEEKKPKGCKCP